MEGDNIEVPKEKSIEGDIVTWRGLRAYAHLLRFEPHLLTGQTVLNFGSGGSHIGKELEKKKILCNVIDVDLELPGVGKKSLLSATLRLIDQHVNPDSDLHRQLAHMRRLLTSAKGRNFIQGDGRSLPFEDKAFDTVLAFASTQQIPDADRELVFRELMRVGNTIHCGPISQSDFGILKRLSEEENFDIITCLPYGKLDDFIANNSKSYQEYRERYPVEQRIKLPAKDSFLVTKSVIRNGSYIVLQRRH